MKMYGNHFVHLFYSKTDVNVIKMRFICRHLVRSVTKLLKHMVGVLSNRRKKKSKPANHFYTICVKTSLQSGKTALGASF